MLALAFFAALVSTDAPAQPVRPLLMSTPIWQAAYLSLGAVQAQVDATLGRAAASRPLIAGALAQLPPPLLPSTPIPRR